MNSLRWDECRIQKKPGAPSSRLARLGLVAGAHTANEADADMSDSPLTSHTTGVGRWVGQCEESQSITYSVTFD